MQNHTQYVLYGLDGCMRFSRMEKVPRSEAKTSKIRNVTQKPDDLWHHNGKYSKEHTKKRKIQKVWYPQF